jgi:hypothetical protein
MPKSTNFDFILIFYIFAVPISGHLNAQLILLPRPRSSLIFKMAESFDEDDVENTQFEVMVSR